MTPPVPRSAFRGFLFADLRGYTAYVERHGNVAAAELLARYRTLVRAEVVRNHGAEIKTEGDSFYVAFRSAHSAVECAVAIAAAAEAATQEDRAHPIHVGIGVHAGETVETGEGYVGSAVNIAARVAAQAKAGDVLVTSTVRELVRGNVDVSFEPRGRRRLKGVEGEVGLFVAGAGATGANHGRSTLPWPAVVATTLAAAGLIIFVGAISRFSGGTPLPSPGADPTQPVAASSPPVSFEDVPVDTELEPGDYVLHFASVGGVQAFPTLSIGFTVPEGWERQRVDGLIWNWNDNDTRLGFSMVDNVYVDTCDPDAGLREPPVGPSVDDLTRAVRALSGWEVVEAEEGSYFGFAGNHLALTGPDNTDACVDRAPRLFHVLGNPGYVPALTDREGVELWIVNVQGTRLVINAHAEPDASPAALEELRTVVESIWIDP